MIFELERAQRMRNAFDGIGQTVREVVHRIDRPRIAGVLMRNLADAIQRRIAKIDVAARHVDLRAQGFRAVGVFAGAHACEQIQIFRDRPIAIRRIATRFRERSAILTNFFGTQIANVSFPIANQFLRTAINHFEIIRRVPQFVPIEAEPVHVVLDRIDVLDIFLRRIRVVETQMANAAEFRREAEIQTNRFGMSQMQIAVGLGRKARDDAAAVLAGRPVVGDDLANEMIDQGSCCRRAHANPGNRAYGVVSPVAQTVKFTGAPL